MSKNQRERREDSFTGEGPGRPRHIEKRVRPSRKAESEKGICLDSCGRKWEESGEKRASCEGTFKTRPSDCRQKIEKTNTTGERGRLSLVLKVLGSWWANQKGGKEGRKTRKKKEEGGGRD